MLQLALALFIFKVPAGAKIFLWVNEAVIRMLDSATAGSRFLFGPLATPPGGEDSLGFILAFQAFPTIIFFSALIAVLYYEKDNNLFEAIIQGSQGGVKMIVGISALLIAVLGLVALIDLGLASLGGLFSAELGEASSLKALCGYLFYPLTLALGVPLEDAGLVSQIIGGRLIVTEVVAYQDLAAALADGRFVHPRSAVITTYALCGFAHLASMAIFVGGLCALAPERTRDMGRVAVRALAAATLACLMTACVAGTFFDDSGSILLGE